MGRLRSFAELWNFGQSTRTREEGEEEARRLCQQFTGWRPTAGQLTPAAKDASLMILAAVVCGEKTAVWLVDSQMKHYGTPGNEVFDALINMAQQRGCAVKNCKVGKGMVVAKSQDIAEELDDAINELKHCTKDPDPHAISPQEKHAHFRIGMALGYPPEVVMKQFGPEGPNRWDQQESFRHFLENEEKENVNKMLAKLPKGHQKLLKGYKFHYTPGNTLKGDDEHIGFIHNDKIVVAAPWNYGREFTTLHEIAHLVWEKLMTPKLKKEWEAIVKRTKNKQDQNPEELFCMAYACHYAKHKVKVHDHPEWHDFIAKLPV
jgi:hypothetical protein